MKKLPLLFVFAFVFSRAAMAQYESIRFPLSTDDKVRISRYNLKSMKLYFVDGKQDSLIEMMQYDRNGKLTKSLSDGIVYNYTYDKNQNTIAMTDSAPKNANSPQINDTFTFQYDTNGFLKRARFDSDQSVFTYDPRTATLVEIRKYIAWPEPVICSYAYNAHKDMTEMHFTDAPNQSRIAEDISYDDKYHITKDAITRKYAGDNVDTVITNYTYNDKGKRVLEETYSSSDTGKVHRYTQTHSIRKDFYDGQGRLTEEFLFENGQEMERFEFTYNEYGNEPLSETYYSKGVKERMDIFTLDEQGLPATLTETEAGQTTKYKYVFERW